MRTLKKQTDSKTMEKIKDNFFVFDTETTALEPIPENFVFGVIYGYNFTKVIHCVEDFKNEFNKKKYEKKFIFAHNAEFDLLTIFGNLYLNVDNSTIFNGRFISAKYKEVTFADSMNIYDVSVKKIGVAVGLEKLENTKVSSEGLNKNNITDEDITYCIRDCEIVYTALLKIFEYTGCIKITLASLSLYNFRNKHLINHIVFSELVDEFFESYYGGRTEAFKIGETTSKVFDINSLYPSVMNNMYFPDVRTLKKETKVDIKYFNYVLKNFEGCAKITISHAGTYFGYLPYKSEEGKLLFPCGTFTGCWNFNEIRFAIENKVIQVLSCEYVVYSVRVKSPFTEFVQEHYNRRINATDELDKWIEKYILNKLYGKFAQRIKHTTTYYDNIPYELIEELEKTEKFYQLKTFSETRPDCFIVTENEKFVNSFFSIPTYSSYITSQARIVLLKSLLQNQNNNVVYCDTDSIFLEGTFEGKVSKELGDFKEEEKTVIQINGLKNYVYKDSLGIHETIKGISKRSIKIGKNKYSTEKYYKTKEALRRQKTAGTKFTQVKELKHEYDKRIVNKNDGTTKPIKL